MSLFGLAPDGVCHASDVTIGAVSSYLTFSPLPRPVNKSYVAGSIFSVALSIPVNLLYGIPGFPGASCSSEPGLSSPTTLRVSERLRTSPKKVSIFNIGYRLTCQFIGFLILLTFYMMHLHVFKILYKTFCFQK